MEEKELWKLIQEGLGYTDAEMEEFKKSPKRVKLAKAWEEFFKYKIVIEVIQARNCGAGHKVGDRFVMNGLGHLLLKECTRDICIYALYPAIPSMSIVFDRICEGIDPNQGTFDRVRCIDIGLECGGWGEVLMEVKAEPVATA